MLSICRLIQRRCDLGDRFVSAGIEALEQLALLRVRTA